LLHHLQVPSGTVSKCLGLGGILWFFMKYLVSKTPDTLTISTKYFRIGKYKGDLYVRKKLRSRREEKARTTH
jgi:hypothetical protein